MIKELALISALVSSPVQHQWGGWQGDAPVYATAVRATIVVPPVLPSGTEEGFGYVMADQAAGPDFTQVGWSWSQGGEPWLFVETGPSVADITLEDILQPGQRITVQVLADNGSYVTQAFAGGSWWTLSKTPLVGDPFWDTQVETYGGQVGTCFTNRGWEAHGVWHHLPAGCVVTQ